MHNLLAHVVILLLSINVHMMNALGGFPFIVSKYEEKFSRISSEELSMAKDQVREMFFFGYNNYIEHAYPMDELDPINCVGRGPDYDNPDNININDVLGDYSLTLIDSLNTLVIMGDKQAFHDAVRLILDSVSFEKDVTVQVFEVTIRVIGSLLSAHLILTNENPFHGNFSYPEYDSELLMLAHDMANRLLPAFKGTNTGLPYPRVNLLNGILPGTSNQTCTAGAGSLLLEFGVLSRLLNDPTFEREARRINEILWQSRNEKTGLLGNVINVQTGEWNGVMAGLGAGFDSFFEYLLKAHILFGEKREYEMFNELRKKIGENMRRGRQKCTLGDGDPPLYMNVDMTDGHILNTWLDALQANFAGVQVLGGDLDDAICSHAFYYAVWQKYELLPERFNWHLKAPDVHFYPLRPEFVESTYLLFLATKSPFYQHIGMQIIDSLNLHTRVGCGFATVHNVQDKSLENRMESFFLSETCKYLFLLFDVDNPVNRVHERLLFSTEGHTFPIVQSLRRPPVGRAYEGSTDELFLPELLMSRESSAAPNESCHTLKTAEQELGLNHQLLRPPPISAFHMGQYLQMVDASMDLDD